MMILLFIIIIAVIYYNSKGQGLDFIREKNNDPEETLKQRFAKGEIDETTYLKMKLTIKE